MGKFRLTSIILVFFLSLLVQTELVRAQQSTAFDKRGLDQYVLKQMERDKVPSAAVGIIKNGEIIHSETYNNHQYTGTVTPESVFFLGSTSKLITAAGVIRLEEQGKLALEDKAYMHLPQPFADNFRRSVPDLTISHLIEHTSGISRWSGYFNGKSELSTDDITFSNQPGTVFEYSSMNYILLGKIIAHVSQMSYADFMQKGVFEPWEMTQTATSLGAINPQELVLGHSYLGYFAIPVAPTNAPEQLVPMGYIASSLSDMSQFLKNLSLLSYFSDKKINQAGMDRGYSSRVVWVPDEKLGIVILTNVNSFTASNNLLKGITTALDEEVPMPVLAFEPLLRLLLASLFVYELIFLIKSIIQWIQNGYKVQKRWYKNKKRLARFLFNAMLNIGFFFGVLFYFSITPSALLHIQPDLGIFLIFGTIVSLVKAGLHTVIIEG